jgi:hypothetical protein
MNLTDLGLTAFIDHRHPKGILVTPPNAWAGLNWHDHPYRTRSGDHKNRCVWGRHLHAKYRYPKKFRTWYFKFTHEDCSKLNWIRRRGSILYVMDLCESGVGRKIFESGSGSIRISFSPIRGSGSRPDPALCAFYVFMIFLTGQDPRIRIWVCVSFRQLLKNFNQSFFIKLNRFAPFFM